MYSRAPRVGGEDGQVRGGDGGEPGAVPALAAAARAHLHVAAALDHFTISGPGSEGHKG